MKVSIDSGSEIAKGSDQLRPYKRVELEFSSEELQDLKKHDRELYDYLIQSISGVKEDKL